VCEKLISLWQGNLRNWSRRSCSHWNSGAVASEGLSGAVQVYTEQERVLWTSRFLQVHNIHYNCISQHMICTRDELSYRVC